MSWAALIMRQRAGRQPIVNPRSDERTWLPVDDLLERPEGHLLNAMLSNEPGEGYEAAAERYHMARNETEKGRGR